MIKAEPRPVARGPIAVAILAVLGVALLVASVVYLVIMIVSLDSVINGTPNTNELRTELNREFPPGTSMTEITSYLDSEKGRYDVKNGSEVDEYFQTLGLAQGTERSQVESVVDAVTPIQGGFLASARLLFYFDGDGRLVRLVVCQEYDCAA